MIKLYIPKIDDYWYEEKIQSDPKTMKYNAGYDVNYYGYHYDTGCIDFPKEKWQEMYEKRQDKNRYFAYLKNEETFVGYVNYQLVDNRYECGIVIEDKYRGKGYAKEALQLLINVAKKNNIKELYDNFEIYRDHALGLFLSVGFEIVEHQKWQKFGQEVDGVLIKIKL
jgi:RimJ/RimL family protein N-acetyltransferase